MARLNASADRIPTTYYSDTFSPIRPGRRSRFAYTAERRILELCTRCRLLRAITITCGARQKQEQESRTRNGKREKKKTVLLTAIVVGVAFAVIISGLIFFLFGLNIGTSTRLHFRWGWCEVYMTKHK